MQHCRLISVQISLFNRPPLQTHMKKKRKKSLLKMDAFADDKLNVAQNKNGISLERLKNVQVMKIVKLLFTTLSSQSFPQHVQMAFSRMS